MSSRTKCEMCPTYITKVWNAIESWSQVPVTLKTIQCVVCIPRHSAISLLICNSTFLSSTLFVISFVKGKLKRECKKYVVGSSVFLTSGGKNHDLMLLWRPYWSFWTPRITFWRIGVPFWSSWVFVILGTPRPRKSISAFEAKNEAVAQFLFVMCFDFFLDCTLSWFVVIWCALRVYFDTYFDFFGGRSGPFNKQPKVCNHRQFQWFGPF